MAPLQKRALWGLGVGILWAVITGAVFFTGGGVSNFNDNSSFRLVIDALFIAWLVVYAAIMAPVLKFGHKKDGKVIVDERDRVIVSQAPLVQLWAVIIALVAWTLGLTEGYFNQGQVPVLYLYLMFFTTISISSIAQSLGILIGYWRMNRNA
jgi:hypothetical protein